jgi:tRNA(Ile)-lysidine synthetase-like protein
MSADASPPLAPIPSGRWAVAVSGGADSVALLHLLRRQPGLWLHVVHLNHQARGQESDADAAFVAELAARCSLPCTIAQLHDIEPQLTFLPANRSARYRAVRLELFRRVTEAQHLQGILLAHHADDQAETVLLRLLRGSGPTGLTAMTPRQRIGRLLILRPLLLARRDDLRRWLASQGETWREDASNQSDQYARNRIRKWLNQRPEFIEPLFDLSLAARCWRAWIRSNAPKLPSKFFAIQLAQMPRMLARESARRWLMQAGVAADHLTPDLLDRLRTMATDAASQPRQQFPGSVCVRRRAARMWAEASESDRSA